MWVVQKSTDAKFWSLLSSIWKIHLLLPAFHNMVGAEQHLVKCKASRVSSARVVFTRV